MRITSLLLLGTVALAGSATAALAAGVTEPQARYALSESCSNVSDLHRAANGEWYAICSKGSMKVDTSGKVSASTGGPAGEGLTQGQAHYLLNNNCSNVSTLSQDKGGNWHAICSKGAMMVTPKGEVVADKGHPAGELSEGHARSIASDSCSNVSRLTTNDQGHWIGSCSKGNFAIDPSGKIAFK